MIFLCFESEKFLSPSETLELSVRNGALPGKLEELELISHSLIFYFCRFCCY